MIRIILIQKVLKIVLFFYPNKLGVVINNIIILLLLLSGLDGENGMFWLFCDVGICPNYYYYLIGKNYLNY